jgi:putative FmdB family regulatory protein
MPIYGYNCRSCEHSFDALQKMSDPVLEDCPECGAASLRKLLSAPKFRLKGKGWYETDFKTGDQRNIAGDAQAKSDSKPKDGDTKSTEKSKDADKPAKKADAKKSSPVSKAKTA